MRLPADIEQKFLYVRKEFELDQMRTSWYLQRHYGITVYSTAVRQVLVRNSVIRLPRRTTKPSPSTFKRYENEAPVHQVQVDANFPFFKDKRGRRIKLFQYTSIGDARVILKPTLN